MDRILVQCVIFDKAHGFSLAADSFLGLFQLHTKGFGIFHRLLDHLANLCYRGTINNPMISAPTKYDLFPFDDSVYTMLVYLKHRDFLDSSDREDT